MLFIVVIGLALFAYVAVNVGSKEKMSFVEILIPMLIVCLLAYFASPWLSPIATWLMQVGQNLPIGR